MIIFIAIILMLYTFITCKKKQYHIPLFVSVGLILFVGLRYRYGYDYENYHQIYMEITTLNDLAVTLIEKGFASLILIFREIGLGFQTFLLFIATVSISCKIKVINELSKLPIVSLLIYFLMFFLYNDAEQIRHGLALGITFLSIYFLIKNQKVKSIVLIICATLIHYSAILFFIVPLIYKLDISKKKYIILIALSIIVAFVNLFSILQFINDNLLHIDYLTNKLIAYSSESSSVISLSLILRIVFFLFYITFAYDRNDNQEKAFVNIYFIGIVVFCLATSIPVLAARSSIYMRYVEMLLMPLYMVKVKGMPYKKLQYSFVSIYWIYYIFTFTTAIIDPKYLIYCSI